jgi:hypothetical protein
MKTSKNKIKIKGQRPDAIKANALLDQLLDHLWWCGATPEERALLMVQTSEIIKDYSKDCANCEENSK